MKKSFYRREVELHTGSLKSILLRLDKESIKTVLDGLCGVGFGASILHKYLPNASIVVNDLDKNCIDHLISSLPFPHSFHRVDINLLILYSQPGEYDLMYLDFNTFTMKNRKWLDLLKMAWKKVNCWLLFTDTACFGFKFSKNLGFYDVTCPLDYYVKLAKEIMGELEGHLRFISGHNNAAIVALGKEPGIITCLSPEPLSFVEKQEERISLFK